MLELGSKEGQGQGEKTPFFDSSKISDKKAAEHFSNVEGAAERARQAERARIAAEKEAREVHAADVRAASEQMKKAQKAESGKKGGIVKFLFGGWHKIVTIVILLAIVAGGVFLVIRNMPESEDIKLEKDRAAQELAQSIYVEAEDVRLDGSYEDAKKKFEDALNNCSREEKIFITTKYAEYIAFMEYDAETANSMVDSVATGAETEMEKSRIESAYNMIDIYTEDN